MAEEGQYMEVKLYNAAIRRGTGIPPEATDQGLKARTLSGNNVLHIAAQYGNAEFVAAALARLGNENQYDLVCQQNSKCDTPLHVAAEFGHVEIVKALLSAHDGNQWKPCWSVTDKHGDTPLHKALSHGREDVALCLLKRDIKLVSVDNYAGESPAYLAADSFCNGSLKEILDADKPRDCFVSFSGSFGQTVFHPARRLKATIISRLIEMRKGHLKDPDNKGKTVLHYAVEENRLVIVKTLLKEDNSLAYLQDNEGLTSLHIASKMGLFPMVQTILKLCPQSVEICDNLGRTALHIAKRGDDGFLKKCLNNVTIKNLINQADNDGNTPLHIALINSEHRPALLLLNVNGCNWRLKNNEGCTPLNICKTNDKIYHYSPVYIELRHLVDGPRWECMRNREWRQRLVRIMDSSSLKTLCVGPNLERVEEKELENLLNKAAVVAAILVPLAVSALFSVPGGFDDNGKPVLHEQIAFVMFSLSNEITFFAALVILLLCTFGIGNKRWSKKQLASISIRLLQVALTTTFVTYMSGKAAISEKLSTFDTALIIIQCVGFVVLIVIASKSIVGNVEDRESKKMADA